MSSLFLYADGSSRLVQRDDNYTWERVGALRDSILPPEPDDVSVTLYSPAGDVLVGPAFTFGPAPRQIVDQRGRPVLSEAAARMQRAVSQMYAGIVQRPVSC